jgi:thioredoxin-related protein
MPILQSGKIFAKPRNGLYLHTMNFRTILILILIASSGTLSAWKTIESEPLDKINWITLEEADRLRRTEPRKIMIDVYTDWCGWCKRMDVTTFADPELVAYVNANYYAVKLDAEQKEPITIGGKTYQYVTEGKRGYHQIAHELLQGKMSYPTIVFLDEQMNMIQPIPGYHEAKDLQPILEYLSGNAYKETPWEEWLAKRKVD